MVVVTFVRCDYGEHLKREPGPYVMIGYYGKKTDIQAASWVMDMNADAGRPAMERTVVKYNGSKITCTNHIAFEYKTENNK